MTRQRIITWSLVFVITAITVAVLWPHLNRAYISYQIGHTFFEWDGFGEAIRSTDTVEVLVLGRRAKEGDADIMSGYGDFLVESKLLLKGEDIHRLTTMWPQLIYSPRSTSLCHGPAYGLRYSKSGKVIGEAMFCWHCSNVYLNSREAKGLYGFDANHGQWLLDYLQKIAPRPEKRKK